MSKTNFFNFVHNADLLSYKTMALFLKQFDKQLNFSQVMLLAYIKRNGQTQPSILAKELGFTYGAITSMVNKLVKAGYLIRITEVTDRRAILLDITPTGVALLDEAESLGIDIRNKVYSILSEEEVEQMIHIQNKLLKHVNTLE